MNNDKSDKTEKLAILSLEKALEIRNSEIDNFWKRGWFFGALFISLLTIDLNLLSKNLIYYAMFISFLLLIVSFFQALMNRGSKYWQERWEYKVKNLESSLKVDITLTERFNKLEHDYIHYCILAKNENRLSRATRFSVSKITILIWDLLTLCSLLLWINNILFFFHHDIPILYKTIGFHILIILYIFSFLKNSKWYEPLEQKEQDKQNLYKDQCRKYIHDYING